MTGALRRRAMLAGLLAALLPSTALPEPVVREPREVERLLREASPVLVAVSIQSNTMWPQIFERYEFIPVRRLTFHVPASTVFRARTREGAGGGQLLGFPLWSRARFVVTCNEWGEDPALVSPGNCQLRDAFGDWPLFLWVHNDRTAAWEETHARAVAWLERHLAPESRAALGGMR